MSILNVDNPLINDTLNIFKRTDSSKFEMYTSIRNATTLCIGEIAKTLDSFDVKINTLYGESPSKAINHNFRIVTRIRAGLPMVESLSSYLKCGNISYILLDRENDSKIMYSTVNISNKFEKVIYAEPFIIDEIPVRIVIEHLLSQGAMLKNIVIVILSTPRNIVESLNRDYPDATFIVCMNDDFFINFKANDKHYDDIGGIIFGEDKVYNNLKKRYFLI